MRSSRISRRFRRKAITRALAFESLEHRNLLAAAFPMFRDPNPDYGNIGFSNGFGVTVVALSTGNVVITSPGDDAGGEDAGAVYLFNGGTGALISTLRGSSAGDLVGRNGVVALTNGNYVISSGEWDNGATKDAGAVTFGNGVTGVSGVVSAANSLVGSSTNDGFAMVTALTNGNYVVINNDWDKGTVVDVGAVTFGNGTTGISGVISPENSLVGSKAGDFVGRNGEFPSVTVLTNGNYVVSSTLWDNGDVENAGAVTFGNGTTGIIGIVSAANSLIASSTTGFSSSSDYLGVKALSNGNYVVSNPSWDNDEWRNVGAVTFGNGTTGVVGTVSAANSLVGSNEGSFVGGEVTALTNGNYVVNSPGWGPGWGGPMLEDAGAVTFGNGTTGITGIVGPENSLVGSSSDDRVGIGSYVYNNAIATTYGRLFTFNGVVALANGNYVVISSHWNNGRVRDAGAVTFGNGTTGVVGTISAANSMIGSTAFDKVGDYGVAALTNGNYVINSPLWDNGTLENVGAITFGSGTTGTTGVVSTANSLVGSSTNDFLGLNDVTALTNGNYVISSPYWDNGSVKDVGAVTFGNGKTAITGVVSAANSLIGSTAEDSIGSPGVTPLANGNYVVRSPRWDNGAMVNVGAVTFGNGTTGVSGAVSPTNSLVGSTTDDHVGGVPLNAQSETFPMTSVLSLPNGNYVIASRYWDNGAVADAGAITFGNSTTGTVGPLTSLNSTIGSPLRYFGLDQRFVDWRIGSTRSYIIDNVNRTFFVADGGRVRVGSQVDGFAPRAVSIAATDADKAEGNSGTTPFTFEVARSGDLSESMTVNFAVTGTGDTPAQASDFVGSVFPTGQVSFSANESKKVIAVIVVSDRVVEGNETFAVTLSGATRGASIGVATAVGTIQDAACLTVGPLVAGANRLTYSCASPGAFVGFVMGARVGSSFLSKYGVNVYIADPTTPATEVANASGFANFNVNLTAAQVNQELIFQGFEIAPKRSVGPVLIWSPTPTRADVNRDGMISPIDVLMVINRIARRESFASDEREQSASSLSTSDSDFDVNGDGNISPIDVLIVINALSRRPASFVSSVSTSGESASSSQATPLFIFDERKLGSDDIEEELLSQLVENQLRGFPKRD